MIAACLLATVFLQRKYTQQNVKFEEVGLGEGTSSYAPVMDGYPIQAIRSLAEVELIRQGWEKRQPSKTILWLGNSQLHGINQYQAGDQNAVEALHHLLKPSATDVVAFSLPNANLQEHYLLFEYFIQHIKIDKLLIPVFLDDTRENGIRSTLVDQPLSSELQAALSQTASGQRILEVLAPKGEDQAQGSAETAGIKETIQEKVETSLTNWLSQHSTVWRSREQARGDMYLTLYNTRNKAFGITPNSQRKIIPANYQANMTALEDILRLARQKGIQVQVYIPPIRSDLNLPYDPQEYTKFKQETSDLCSKYQAKNIDLEGIVPNQYWKVATSGSDGSAQLDFMHFEAPGHQILADSIFKHLQETR